MDSARAITAASHSSWVSSTRRGWPPLSFSKRWVGVFLRASNMAKSRVIPKTANVLMWSPRRLRVAHQLDEIVGAKPVGCVDQPGYQILLFLNAGPLHGAQQP